MEPERIAVAFSRLLRRAGVAVPVGATLTFAEALAAVGLARRADVYWAGRATLVTRPEELAVYDRAFAAFWRAGSAAASPDPAVVAQEAYLAFDEDTGPEDAGGDDAGDVPVVSVRWSRAEVLRRRDFAELDADELDEARRLMDDLRVAGAWRRSRRQRATRHARGTPDVRRTVRRALRAQGEPVSRAYRAPAARRRRIVLLLDVSGSMEPYARAFVRFLHAAVVSRAGVEAFALGTRLTRMTRDLRTRDPDAAIAAASARVVDWAGGTRLGECMRTFNDTWGVKGMARGAVVVIVSDGWDRGDSALLGEQMARLARVAHRIVWVNPLKASPGYAPLAQGMAAALPHVDAFVEGHSLEALQEVATAISAPGTSATGVTR